MGIVLNGPPNGRIIAIPIDSHTNLPLFYDFFYNEDKKRDFGAPFANMVSQDNEYTAPILASEDDHEYHKQHCPVRCCQCAADEIDQNLINCVERAFALTLHVMPKYVGSPIAHEAPEYSGSGR